MSQRYIGGLIYNPPGGFSGAFDGTGDFLSGIGTTSSFNFMHNSSALFTAECWVYLSSTASEQYLFANNDGGSAQIGCALSIVAGGALSLFITRGVSGVGNVTAYVVSTGTVPANQWTHVAVTYDQSQASSNAKFYINGASAGTGNKTGNTPSGSNATNTLTVGAATSGGLTPFNGYISNFRINNSIVYTAAFNPPVGQLQAITNTSLLTCAYSTFRDGSTNNFTITVNGNTAVSTQNPFPLTTLPNPALGNQGNGVYSMSQYQSLLSQNLWPAVDPYWRYVTLMLHGNGTNGAQNNTFLDSSTNNFSITRNGNTTQGTFTPYGSNWSNYFDGSGDYLTAPANAAYDFGTGDFTVEFWFNRIAAVGQSFHDSLLGNRPTGFSSGRWHIYIGPAVNDPFTWQARTPAGDISLSGGTCRNGEWNHIAVVRNGSTITLYINGTSISSLTTATSIGNLTDAISVGAFTDGAYPCIGYFSNARIVKGTAVYTSAFTPPTAPLTAITNTSLLTCQSNRFIDNSSNAFTITRNGDVSVQRFSPFNPTAPYSAATVGGSGYFDGSGDYLTVADNAALQMASGDFTIEFWINFSSITGYQTPFDKGYTNAGGLLFQTGNGNGRLIVYAAGSAVITETGTGATGTWIHYALVRSGTTLTLYRDGVSTGSATNSTNFNNANQVGVGANGTGAGGTSIGQYPINGYMSNVRVVKGTAVYTSAFTPPTAPLTAITNTSLLLNFTNGGIIDNAMMNDLETVGNAQISTSVSKFGGGSMSFVRSPSSYLVANNATGLLSLGTSNWTVEAWIYMNTLPAGNGYPDSYWIVGGGPSGNNTGFDIAIGSTNLQVGLTTFTSLNINSAHGMAATTWYHIAVVRSGATLYAFINGNQLATASVSGVTVDPCLTGLAVSAAEPTGATSGNFNGYIDDLRLTKGYARYTANFTPQRSQWQDQ